MEKESSQGSPNHSGIYDCSLFRTQIAVCHFETNDRINGNRENTNILLWNTDFMGGDSDILM